jgi:hypothetical protein
MTALTLPLGDSCGVIRRDIGARLVNISMSGCLLETASPLPIGLVGTLQMTIGTTDYDDLVRVVRCQGVEGTGHRHHIAVQFVWADVPAERSLRRAAGWGGPFGNASTAVAFRST